ncbi:MAG TPA: hypothetical protein PLL64_01425 [Rhodothermales bacterium]|nr:hypothetical protein [Rhodothermales bacterium]HRR09258.1 hypothetical protein [Rhodothermales bacterium]
MDPNLIPVVAIIMGAVIAISSIVAKTRRHKWDLDAKMLMQKDDRSMSSSELKGMIQEAVSEATAPLQQRLEALEIENKWLKSAMPPLSAELESDDKSLGRNKIKTD